MCEVKEKIKVLFLCTGNACRSQMAEGILRTLAPGLEVHSAGVFPANIVQPYAIKVCEEIGVDISKQYPKDVALFLGQDFDYVITVCDYAKEACPHFVGQVKHYIHYSLEDPTFTIGTEEEVLAEFRRIRDEIRVALEKMVKTINQV